MGKLAPNSLLIGITGTIDTLVFRNVNGKTIISKKPDMSRAVKNPSMSQKKEQGNFKEAQAYAKNIIRNPELKAAFAAKLPKGKRVYNAAIAEYYKLQKEK